MMPTADRITQALLAVIALVLMWQALRPHVAPVAAEGARDVININVERIAGRYLTDGATPVKCIR
jgi:hypothetical protein